MTKDERARRFLEQFGFSVLEWDGVEITVFYQSGGEPFVQSEFRTNSETRREFSVLEKAFRRVPSGYRYEIPSRKSGKEKR